MSQLYFNIGFSFTLIHTMIFLLANGAEFLCWVYRYANRTEEESEPLISGPASIGLSLSLLFSWVWIIIWPLLIVATIIFGVAHLIRVKNANPA